MTLFMTPRSRNLVFDRTISKVRPADPSPVLSSAALGDWKGFWVEAHHMQGVEQKDVVWMHHVVVLQVNGPVTIERKVNGAYLPQRIEAGQVTVLPAMTNVTMRTSELIECVSVGFDPTVLEMTCPDFASPQSPELLQRWAVDDAFARGVCLALKEEVERRGGAGRAYAESLVTSLAMHVATRYSAPRESNGAMGGRERTPPPAVRKAMQFISERFDQDVGLEEIAAAVGLSPFHFSRMFKQSVGISPYQFVLRQRIERAKQYIRCGDISMADIAVRVGFFDQSHFAHHFKKSCGVTPGQYASQVRL